MIKVNDTIVITNAKSSQQHPYVVVGIDKVTDDWIVLTVTRGPDYEHRRFLLSPISFHKLYSSGRTTQDNFLFMKYKN